MRLEHNELHCHVCGMHYCMVETSNNFKCEDCGALYTMVFSVEEYLKLSPRLWLKVFLYRFLHWFDHVSDMATALSPQYKWVMRDCRREFLNRRPKR